MQDRARQIMKNMPIIDMKIQITHGSLVGKIEGTALGKSFPCSMKELCEKCKLQMKKYPVEVFSS